MRRGGVIGALVAAVATAGAGAGCGLPLGGSAPTTDAATSRATATNAATSSAVTDRAAVATAQRTHEFPTPAPRPAAAGGWRSPVQAVEVFADTYVNWTAATVATHLRLLAEASVGQARSAMTLAAAQIDRDYELRRGGIANSGTVEAIAPVTGRRDQYAVVTREQTTATNTGAYRGLQPTWHVSLATVTRVQGGLWTLSAWQPES
jgi:hypothetical protein